MDKKWVVCYGDIFEGFKGVVGPFANEEEAEEYSEIHNLGHFTKAVFELEMSKDI